ncbi:MAG: MHS family proline/betaine transporter-like MFS transporter [Francisella sp.]|jgi:MHS family proline/betaine transporter-like MFS transporter
MKKYKKLLFASLGVSFEYYDLAIYYLFAVSIGNKFFGEGNAVKGVFFVSIIYLITYAARPLGALLLGRIADKKGRVFVLRVNMFILFVSTLCLGLLPGIEVIGIMAPILFVSLRFVQCLALGSEIPVSIVFITESYPHRRGLMLSIISVCLSLGIMMTSVVYFLLSHYTTDSFMHNYGWRVGYLIGALFTLSLFFLRRGISDIPNIYREINNHEIKKSSFFSKVFVGTMLVAFIALAYSELFQFLLPYVQIYIEPNLDISGMLIFGSLTMAIGAPIGGFISDYVSRTKMLAIIVIISMVLSSVFYMNLIKGQSFYIPFIVLTFVIGFFFSTYNIIVLDFFTLDRKCQGLGLSYTLGYLLFSSGIPALTIVVSSVTDSLLSPLYLIYFAGLVTLLGVVIVEIFTKKA